MKVSPSPKQQICLFENALKFYIQKEDACGFQEFFQHKITQESKYKNCLRPGSAIEPQRKKSGDVFSFAKVDPSIGIASRKPSNPRARRINSISESDQQHFNQKRSLQQSENSSSKDRISPQKKEGQLSQIIRESGKLDVSLREMSPEKIAVSRDEGLENNALRMQSPYDPQWIERILKKNYNMRILCENEQNHVNHGVKPKLKAFRITLQNNKLYSQQAKKDQENEPKKYPNPKADEITKQEQIENDELAEFNLDLRDFGVQQDIKNKNALEIH